MPFQKASDYEPSNDHSKFFITGDYGTGKSVFSSSFPTPGFVFNFDKKILTYKESGGEWDYSEYDISPKGWAQYAKDQSEVTKAVASGHYKTVVYDSTSAWTDICMAQALALDPKRSPSGGPIWNVHFQLVRNLMEGKLQAAINMKCNLVVIAHLNIQTDDDGNIVGINPLLTGQLAVRVPGYFEEVYCAFTRTKQGGGTEWYLRTIPRGHYKARSTMSGTKSLLPPELPNNYAAVMAAYKTAVDKRKEK